MLKTFKTEVLEVKEENKDTGIVTIAISKFDNIDSYGDIVRKGAFKKTFLEGIGRLRHVVDHNLKQTAVVGLPLRMYETEDYAVVESAINLDKQIGRELFSDYKFFAKHGKTLEHSYMFNPLKYEIMKNDDGDFIGLDIKEVKLFEYSTVARGANPDTPLLGLKSFINGERTEEQIKSFLKVNVNSDTFVKDLITRLDAEKKAAASTLDNGLNWNEIITKL